MLPTDSGRIPNLAGEIRAEYAPPLDSLGPLVLDYSRAYCKGQLEVSGKEDLHLGVCAELC